MITRWLVIILALLAAGYRASHGAMIEAAGLAALGVGLLVRRVGGDSRAATAAAYTCFAITVIAMIVVFVRDYL
ncbi:MAG TPA: hypothetical protein VMM93_11000 [Vicinamibacterales bacterium]|nr:hypothetical protein [Vicinamibacterales bacterium]